MVELGRMLDYRPKMLVVDLITFIFSLAQHLVNNAGFATCESIDFLIIICYNLLDRITATTGATMAVGIYVNDFHHQGITPPPPLVTGPFTLEQGLDDMMTRLMRGGELTTSGYCVGLVNLQDPENGEAFERILYNATGALYDFLSAASRWFTQPGMIVGSDEHEHFIREQLLKALKIELNEPQRDKAAQMPREDFLMAVGIAVENNGDLELFD